MMLGSQVCDKGIPWVSLVHGIAWCHAAGVMSGTGDGIPLQHTDVVQGSLYPIFAHYHLREVLFNSIAMKDRQGRAIIGTSTRVTEYSPAGLNLRCDA